MLDLFGHPFSSYCQKVLIALYENDTPFALRMLAPDQGDNIRAFGALWPIGKMPVLVDGDRSVMESSVIIEYLHLRHPGPVRLLPSDADDGLNVRFMDRVFDFYVMTPMQQIVADFMRPEGGRDPAGVAQARALLDRTCAWLDGHLAGQDWAAGSFSLADCAAAPSLFYADWVHPFAGRWPVLAAYRQRLLARPSVARAVEGARPFRKLFPPGAPDRD